VPDNAQVLVLLADGFREVAVLPCVASLRNAGVKTMLVGLKGSSVTGAQGIAVHPDALLSEMPAEEGETMVVVPGGPRCTRALLTDPRVHALLQEAVAHGGAVVVLSGAEQLVDQAIAGAATFHHQGRRELEPFLWECVGAVMGLHGPADLDNGLPF
jgi:putative intracellular protease/amidase